MTSRDVMGLILGEVWFKWSSEIVNGIKDCLRLTLHTLLCMFFRHQLLEVTDSSKCYTFCVLWKALVGEQRLKSDWRCLVYQVRRAVAGGECRSWWSAPFHPLAAMAESMQQPPSNINSLKEHTLKKLSDLLDKTNGRGWRKLAEIVGADKRFKLR